MKIDELNEILDSTELYLANLMKEEKFKYYPAREGLTNYGKNLEKILYKYAGLNLVRQ